MHILEMVCPNLKKLEGLAPAEPVLENDDFIQRNNQSGEPVRTNGKHTLVCHSFLYLLHSTFVPFQRDAQQHVLALFYCSVCFVVVFVCHKENLVTVHTSKEHPIKTINKNFAMYLNQREIEQKHTFYRNS